MISWVIAYSLVWRFLFHVWHVELFHALLFDTLFHAFLFDLLFHALLFDLFHLLLLDMLNCLMYCCRRGWIISSTIVRLISCTVVFDSKLFHELFELLNCFLYWWCSLACWVILWTVQLVELFDALLFGLLSYFMNCSICCTIVWLIISWAVPIVELFNELFNLLFHAFLFGLLFHILVGCLACWICLPCFEILFQVSSFNTWCLGNALFYILNYYIYLRLVIFELRVLYMWCDYCLRLII